MKEKSSYLISPIFSGERKLREFFLLIDRTTLKEWPRKFSNSKEMFFKGIFEHQERKQEHISKNMNKYNSFSSLEFSKLFDY